MKKMSLNMMRVACLALLTFLMALPLGAKTEEVGGAKINFAETVYNFGNIKEEKGPVSCEFEFVNIGNGNLVILDAKAECGCTKPSYPQKPVAPGRGGKIKVTFNPVGRAGSFTKNITVRCSGKPSKVVLKIKGTVIPK